jgi:predicted nucleic acid-binding protein
VRSFYLDASALAKRYSLELGTPLLNHLFTSVPLDRLYVFNVGMAEVASLLVRKKNADLISTAALTQALADLRVEIVFSSGLQRIVATNALVTSALALIETHSINATDAVILQSALGLRTRLHSTGDDIVVMASDQRLLRAAQAEGLITFNPETQSQADLDALL